MCDAGGELAKRGELLRLHQAILRSPQVFQRCGQFARAGLHAFEQSYVFDRKEDRHVLDVLGLVVGPVDRLHVPAVGLVALADVLGQRDVGVVLDRDPVGVVDDGEVPELLHRAIADASAETPSSMSPSEQIA